MLCRGRAGEKHPESVIKQIKISNEEEPEQNSPCLNGMSKQLPLSPHHLNSSYPQPTAISLGGGEQSNHLLFMCKGREESCLFLKQNWSERVKGGRHIFLGCRRYFSPNRITILDVVWPGGKILTSAKHSPGVSVCRSRLLQDPFIFCFKTDSHPFESPRKGENAEFPI